MEAGDSQQHREHARHDRRFRACSDSDGANAAEKDMLFKQLFKLQLDMNRESIVDIGTNIQVQCFTYPSS